MGRVYLGVAPGRYVAVKQIFAALGEDEAFLAHFGRELDNLTRLPHDFRAPLLASDRTARPPWFATEFIPGLTLSEVVRLHGGALPAAALRRLLHDMLTGLAAVHARRIVHRDLKPSNVMTTPDGFLLIDFGIARAADQSAVTRTGYIAGTPPFMAPEQASGAARLTSAVDVFALGSLLAYAASGKPPFGDSSGPEQLYRIVHQQPDLARLREADAELGGLAADCLAKDPAARPSAAELLGRLRGRGGGVPAAPAWPEPVAVKLARRSAFAATAPEPGALPPTVAEAVSGTVPEPRPPVPSAPSGLYTGRRRERERQRRRPALVAVPVLLVVVVCTAVTLVLQPFQRDDRAGGAPPARTAAPVDPTAAASPGPSSATVPPPTGTPSPTATGGGPSGAEKKRGERAGKHDRARPDGAAPAGRGKGADGHRSPSRDSAAADDHATSSGGSPHRGGSSSSRSSGSSHGSGGKGGGGSKDGGSKRGGSKPAAPAVPSGTRRLRSGATGQCLRSTSNAMLVGMGVCDSETPGGWTFGERAGRTFTLKNRATGNCLGGGSTIPATYGCAQRTGADWAFGPEPGSGFTLKDVGTGQCLSTTGFVQVMAPCNSGDRTQIWHDEKAS